MVIIAFAYVSNLPGTLMFETDTKGRYCVLNLTQLCLKMQGVTQLKPLFDYMFLRGLTPPVHSTVKVKTKPLYYFLRMHAARKLFNNQARTSLSQPLRIVLKDFVCKLYGQDCSSVDEAQYRLFSTKALDERSLPPTSDALNNTSYGHTIRPMNRRARSDCISAPNPNDHGWLVSLDGKMGDEGSCSAGILKFIHCCCKGT